MRVVLAGASGFLGSALIAHLRADGHEILRLVRRPARAADELQWDPATGSLDPAALTGAAAAVNLAGAGVGDKRWSESYKRVLRASRVDSTRTLSAALAALPSPPRVLLSSSAIGYYGDTGSTAVGETAPSGDTFLAGVCRDWEAATRPAEDAGIRVVHLRTGLVLDRRGGAVARMLPLVRLGLAGPLGSGRQFWSWITLLDEIGAIGFLLGADDVRGPVNLTAPEPATNREVTAALARALHRPAVLPVPPPALRIVLGEFAGEVLRSQRVLPRRLLEAGYSFALPDLDAAARDVVAP